MYVFRLLYFDITYIYIYVIVCEGVEYTCIYTHLIQSIYVYYMLLIHIHIYVYINMCLRMHRYTFITVSYQGTSMEDTHECTSMPTLPGGEHAGEKHRDCPVKDEQGA